VLFGDDVIDFEGKFVSGLRKLAVFATVFRTPPDESFQFAVHEV